MTDIEMLPLPPYIHGRELGDNEKALTLQGAERYARAVAEHNVKALQAELDNRWAQGVHTCHDKCQRVACVLRRDNKRLAEALRGLLSRAPGGYGCNEFHHTKADRHGPFDLCPPM